MFFGISINLTAGGKNTLVANKQYECTHLCSALIITVPAFDTLQKLVCLYATHRVLGSFLAGQLAIQSLSAANNAFTITPLKEHSRWLAVPFLMVAAAVLYVCVGFIHSVARWNFRMLLTPTQGHVMDGGWMRWTQPQYRPMAACAQLDQHHFTWLFLTLCSCPRLQLGIRKTKYSSCSSLLFRSLVTRQLHYVALAID